MNGTYEVVPAKNIPSLWFVVCDKVIVYVTGNETAAGTYARLANDEQREAIH